MKTHRRPLPLSLRLLLAGALAASLALPALALGPGPEAPLETRAKWLETQLMAPCCRANPISDHYSGAADAMRRELREMLRGGMDERAILDHYVEQHGEQILSTPRASGIGLVAWLAPAGFLVIGVGAVWLVLGRWRRGAHAAAAAAPAQAAPISDDDARRLERELERHG